jgi:hypothetical protein
MQPGLSDQSPERRVGAEPARAIDAGKVYVSGAK